MRFKQWPARGRRLTIGLSVLALTLTTAGAAIGSPASNEAALVPTRTAASASVETRVNDLLKQMTVDEKLEQVELLPDFLVTNSEVQKGLGSVLSLTDPARINQLQHIAVEQSRLHIPILFAFDTIHGYRTIFPIPLGAASSFDPNVAQTDQSFGARESAAVGLKQMYAPMVDVSHEPRWGRIAEAAGEDPYLNAVFAAARVRGAQGSDYSAPNKVIASPKHFVAYGQPEGGRDYNTTDLSEQRLRNFYLPPFKAAIDAGADTVMCSFNSINGVPGCANSYTETDILKNEWGFDGFIESDWTAVAELRACPPKNPVSPGDCGHGVAADGPDAGAKALMAGTDSEMTSTYLRDFGKQLLADGRITMARLDDAVRRILRVKFRAGLFEHPYVDPTQAESKQLLPDAVAAARAAASRSMVLLKNQNNVLPLDATKSTVVIGPLGNDQHDMLGPWWGVGRDQDAVTVFDGIKAQNPNTTFVQACTVVHADPPDNTPNDVCGSNAGFADAVAAAQSADQVVLALGEIREQSGEAASRVDIDLPGKQQELIDAIKATGKPFTVVLFNGRPLTLGKVDASSPAILEAWFPGVQAGNAVADVLFGKVNPGGKLPVSFPQAVGQIPIYYNHEPAGRPCNVASKWNSRYRDLPTCAPLYPFGYGLSYSAFALSNLRLNTATMSAKGKINVSVDVTNTAGPRGDEVVQLYIHDPVASISQPVRRLRGFQRVTLDPGAKTKVTFTLDASDVGFYNNQGRFVVEPGQIDVYASTSSVGGLTASFTVS
jgi:beta-glucosidase